MTATWRDLAITGMGSMLFTGLAAWVAFGQGAATRVELKEHDAMPTHRQNEVRNARVDAELEALREAMKQMPETFVRLVEQALDQRDIPRRSQ